MTTIAKPGLDVDVIEALDFTLKCKDSKCEREAVEMALHSICDDAMAVCANHAFAIRQLMVSNSRSNPRREVFHVTCDQPVTVDNTTFRTI